MIIFFLRKAFFGPAEGFPRPLMDLLEVFWGLAFWGLGLVEYSENKNRTNIANIQGVTNEYRIFDHCMQDCQ